MCFLGTTGNVLRLQIRLCSLQEPSSAESSSGVVLAPGEAAAGEPEGGALDKRQSFTQVNPMNSAGKAAPGQAAADSPHSSATESALLGSPNQTAVAAVCSISACPPGSTVVGTVCDSNNSHIRPRKDARFGGIAAITDRVAAALASGGLPSAELDGPVSTPNVVPDRGTTAGNAAAAVAHTPGAAAAIEMPPEAADSLGPGATALTEPAVIAGAPGAEQVTPAAPWERAATDPGKRDVAAAAPRASVGPDSSETITDSDVAARTDAHMEQQGGPATFTSSDAPPSANAGTKLQRKKRSKVGVAGGSAAHAGFGSAGAGSSSAGGLSQRIRSPPQRLEPMLHGKKHTMAAVGTSWTADDAQQASVCCSFLLSLRCCWFLSHAELTGPLGLDMSRITMSQQRVLNKRLLSVSGGPAYILIKQAEVVKGSDVFAAGLAEGTRKQGSW